MGPGARHVSKTKLQDCEDAYGHEVFDFHRGKDGYEIVERDDGYIDFSSGPTAYFAEYRDWPSHMRRAMRYVRGRVLDIGCGAGRHSLYLQGKGFWVMGIDQSPLAIRVCKLRGLRHAKVMTITQVNPGLGRFDTILMMGNNFGLFGGRKKAEWLLGRFRAMTFDGARIIAESNDPYKTSNPHHLKYHEFNRNRGRMPGQLRIRVRYRTYATPWFDYLLVSRGEMREILQGSGWRVTRFLDSLGSTYIAVIEKEA